MLLPTHDSVPHVRWREDCAAKAKSSSETQHSEEACGGSGGASRASPAGPSYHENTAIER